MPNTNIETNAYRADCADLILQRMVVEAGENDNETLIDLLSNLMHWCERQDVEFDVHLEIARSHFREEVEAELNAYVHSNNNKV